VLLALASVAGNGCADGAGTAPDLGTSAALPIATSSPASSAPAAPATPSQPATGATVTQQDAPVPVALCELTRDDLAALLATDATGGQDDALRDGVALLEDRLPDWRDVATGNAAAEQAVEAVFRVSLAWRSALNALDSGDDAAAQAALVEADEQADEAVRLVSQLPNASCR
jgi:hypothetical protein